MDIRPVTLEGRVVRLELLDAGHAEALATAAEPGLLRYHFPPRELTAAGFREQIGQLRERDRVLPFAIVDRAAARAIGITCYLDIDARNRSVEIGFTWIARAHQGTQVNPEAKHLMLGHAFDDHGAHRVTLKTDSRNVQSRRAIEKLGAVEEGVLRKHIVMPDGYVRDTVFYGITDDEWPDVKRRLAERLGRGTR